MQSRIFRNSAALACVAMLLATGVSAQTASSGGTCAPTWTAYVTNSATIRGREIASSCTNPDVMRAASALGMARYDPPTIKDVITAQWVLEGTLAPPDDTASAPLNVSRVTLGVSFVVPGLRLDYEGTQPNGTPAKEIVVVSGQYAWNETAPGIGATAAGRAAWDRRAPLIWLTPFGAIWAAIDGAPEQLKVSTIGGKTVIASMIDGWRVTATLDANHRPELVEVQGKDVTYAARYTGYHGDDYRVMTPGAFVWTVNGRPLANLTVTGFRGNPYVVFPVPAAIRTGSTGD